MRNEDALYYLWLSGDNKLHCEEKKLLLELYGGAREVYEADLTDIKQSLLNFHSRSREPLFRLLRNKGLGAAEEKLKRAERFGAEIITIMDTEYPELLRSIQDPPTLLFVKGDISVIGGRCVAIVGTRRASSYGKWAARAIAARIADCGVSVVSGMAFGIDSSAHAGCLEEGGKTAAVLGTGIDICFPRSNVKLWEEIQEKGLLISEFDPGEAGRAYFFPRRNRIISGLCESTVVAEGAMKSGSLITAGFAAEQGRDIFAVPGNIDRPGSAGPNCLIRDGAFPINDVSLVPETLGIGRAHKALGASMSPEEKMIFDMVADSPGTGIDSLSLSSGMRAEKLKSIVSAMELKDILRTEGSFIFVRDG